MILLPYGYKNQRVVLCEIIRDIEKELAELNFQKGVLKNAFNSLESDRDDLIETTSILSQEVHSILKTRSLKTETNE